MYLPIGICDSAISGDTVSSLSGTVNVLADRHL